MSLGIGQTEEQTLIVSHVNLNTIKSIIKKARVGATGNEIRMKSLGRETKNMCGKR
jgi:hypothetical protein